MIRPIIHDRDTRPYALRSERVDEVGGLGGGCDAVAGGGDDVGGGCVAGLAVMVGVLSRGGIGGAGAGLDKGADGADVGVGGPGLLMLCVAVVVFVVVVGAVDVVGEDNAAVEKEGHRVCVVEAVEDDVGARV